MTRRPGTRPRLGNIGFDRTKFAVEDPGLEEKRLEAVQISNREVIRNRASRHLRRLASEHGLDNSVRQLFDKKGRPPPHITLASMMRQYRQMEKQEGWLFAINEELHSRLKELHPVRYRFEVASLRARLRARGEARRTVYARAALDDKTPRLAPKLAAAVGEAIRREIAPKEKAFISADVPNESADMLGARQIQKMMKYVFYDYLPEGDTSVPDDPEAQYEYLAAALNESESQRAKLQENMYELREFIESADLVTRGKNA